MKGIIRIRRALCMFVACFGLISCGGGGGPASEGAPPANKPADSNSRHVFLADNSVFHEAFSGDAESGPLKIRVNLSNSIIQQAAGGTTLYFLVSQSNEQVARLDVKVGGDFGDVFVYPTLPELLTPGSYSSTITVQGCYDQGCSDEFGRATATFNYTIYAHPTIPQRVSLSNRESDNNSSISIDFNGLGLNASDWSVAVNADAVSTDWMTFNTAFADNQGTIEITPSEATCGVFVTTLDVTYSKIGRTHTQTIDIEYLVTSDSPQIASVTPAIQYTNSPIQFTAHGCGFGALNDNELSFENLVLTSVNVVNELLVEVTAEPLAEAGQVIITPNIPADQILELTVRTSDINNEKIVSDSGFLDMTFDESTSTLFLTDSGRGYRAIRLIDDQWQTLDFGYEQDDSLDSIDSSENGRLYLNHGVNVRILNADTFEEISYLDTRPWNQSCNLCNAERLVVMNNNRLLIGRNYNHIDDRVELFDLVTEEVSQILTMQGKQTRSL